MAEVLYPYGWSGSKLTMAQLEAKATISNAHPEFWRRTKPMLDEGKGRLGVGCIWRSSDIQRNTFLDRHYAVASGGCCHYEGRRYQLHKGKAHAAPPGKSFHESTFHGYAAGADMIGDLAWMHSVEKTYGLKDFRNVGNEPWHTQFAELPNSVTQWIAAGRPRPKVWDLPGTPTKPPPPDEEDDMPLTDDDVARIAKAVWAYQLNDAATAKPAATGSLIGWTRKDARGAYEEAHRAAEQTEK